MNVLVTYSSGYGTTKEVSEKIGKLFSEKGETVTVQAVDAVQDLKDYDAVIVGSSIRADRPMANIRDFFARHNHTLGKKQLAIFAVCLAANCEEGRKKVKDEYIAQITEKFPHLKPISTEAFGGKIDFEQLNPVMQQLVKSVLKKTGIETEGSIDTRDWNYIDSWALELLDKLRRAA